MPSLPSDAIPSSSPAFATPAQRNPPLVVKRTVPHPINRLRQNAAPGAPSLPAPLKPISILPISLPAGTLRPHAFRVFTKKHNLTLSSAALAQLASFIGRHCGTGWREDGLAEPVLDEVARAWKRGNSSVIVEGDDGPGATGKGALKAILRTLDGCMEGGKVAVGKSALSRQPSFKFGDAATGEAIDGVGRKRASPDVEADGMDVDAPRKRRSMEVEEAEREAEEESARKDPREWMQVVGAFEQPRLFFDIRKKNFEKRSTSGGMFPPPSHRTDLFRQRYHLVHQRILRNENFQAPTVSTSRSLLSRSASEFAHSKKITQVVNLLGRSGSIHLLLGLLAISPSGVLIISDLSGSIALDLQDATTLPENSAHFAPGMIVLINGTYTELSAGGGSGTLDNTSGIGGTIGGKFIGSVVAHPPCERRTATLGIEGSDAMSGSGPAFGWTDFLGLGSERAVGPRMRRLQTRMLNPDPEGLDATRTGVIAIASEVNLDSPNSLNGLRAMLASYASQPPAALPLAIALLGNFSRIPPLAGVQGAGSIEYKESFDALAAVLSDFPHLLAKTTLVFVPGDKDAWAGAGSAGASSAIPQKPVPSLFTSRVRRAIAEANRSDGGAGGVNTTKKSRKAGEAVWTSNPARLGLFGTAGEIVLFRDDIGGRLRRNGIRFKSSDSSTAATTNVNDESQPALVGGGAQDQQQQQPQLDPDTVTARRLVKTLLDQSHLSPFPISMRPVHWDYAHALQLVPLPSALVIADSETAPFALIYRGCCVMNPGALVPAGGRKGAMEARWVEYGVLEGKGTVRSVGL